MRVISDQGGGWLTRRVSLKHPEAVATRPGLLSEMHGTGGLSVIALSEVEAESVRIARDIAALSPAQRNTLRYLFSHTPHKTLHLADSDASRSLFAVVCALRDAASFRVYLWKTSEGQRHATVRIDDRARARVRRFVESEWLEIASLCAIDRDHGGSFETHLNVENRLVLDNGAATDGEFDGVAGRGRRVVIIEAKDRFALGNENPALVRHIARRFERMIAWGTQPHVAAQFGSPILVLVSPHVRDASALEHLVRREMRSGIRAHALIATDVGRLSDKLDAVLVAQVA